MAGSVIQLTLLSLRFLRSCKKREEKLQNEGQSE